MKRKALLLTAAFVFSLASLYAQTAQTRLDNGKRLFDQENYDGAIREFTEAIRLDPNMAEAYAYRARAYVGDNNDQALSDANRAIQLNSRLGMGYVARGNVYSNKKDYTRAIADYTEAIRLDPKFATAYYNRGLAYANKNDYDRAIADYTEAIKLDPKDASAYNNRGNAYYAKKDYDRVIADYTEAIKLEPTAARYNNRGLAYANKNDYDRAIADYTQAIRLDPRYVNAYYNRGLAYANKNDYDRAIADYTEAIRLGPTATRYASRGNAYYQKGDTSRATADWEAAVRLDPNNSNAKDNLAALKQAQEQTITQGGVKVTPLSTGSATLFGVLGGEDDSRATFLLENTTSQTKRVLIVLALSYSNIRNPLLSQSAGIQNSPEYTLAPNEKRQVIVPLPRSQGGIVQDSRGTSFVSRSVTIREIIVY